MRTRRTFRPMLETMPTLVMPSNVLFVNPLAPVTIKDEPSPYVANPTAPITIPVMPSRGVDYTGPGTTPPLGTVPTIEC